MADDLDRLPPQFAAGTTVSYRRRLDAYPAGGGWSLTLYIAGPAAANATAAADGDSFVVTLSATVTAALAAGLYHWVERVAKGSEVYQVDAGVVTVEANVATATGASQQEWLERAIAALRLHIEQRLPLGMESFQIAGRAVSRIPLQEAMALLNSLESRLARLRDPDHFTRPVLVSFVPPGSSQ